GRPLRAHGQRRAGGGHAPGAPAAPEVVSYRRDRTTGSSRVRTRGVPSGSSTSSPRVATTAPAPPTSTPMTAPFLPPNMPPSTPPSTPPMPAFFALSPVPSSPTEVT